MFTAQEDITIINRPSLLLAPQPITLADVVLTLEAEGSAYIKSATQSDIESLLEPHEHTGLPIYVMIEVALFDHPVGQQRPLRMCFVNNGMIWFHHGENLSRYKLDDVACFASVQINGQDYYPYTHRFEWSNEPQAAKHWAYTFDYEYILQAYHLDGGQDIASFAGFFFIED